MRNAKGRGREGQGKGLHMSQRGFIMLVALILLSGLIFAAATSAIRSTRHTQVSAVELDNTRTFYAAEGAVEYGASELKTLLNNVIDPTQGQLDGLSAPSLPGFTVEQFTVRKVGTQTQERISSGDYTGLDGLVQRYQVEATVGGQRRSTGISREIQHQFIPLFQFGVFYEKDLEIFPGADMTFAGPIHTNGDLYMGCDGATLHCASTVTAVGRYWHYRKDNGHPDLSGPVYVKDSFGNWQNVWRGSYWLDERQTNWASDALSLWDGNFRDAAHGLSTLRLPLPSTSDQHEVIERGVAGDNSMQRAAKYWYKASVRYVDGALKDSAGHVLTQPGVYTYTADKFWDARESKWMDVVDVDVAAMIAGHYIPPNNIVYISTTSGDAPCVRLKNASTLPAGGLTIATDLPMYIWGNYNTVNKRGSSLLADAITLLSPAWADGNSNKILDNRIPTALSVNACVMAGHVATVNGGTYSGGLENLFRFLEKWSGVTVTYRGSIIDLWYSRKATAPWGNGCYAAPNRNWAYDTDLLSPANWPPGTPSVHTVQRGAWRQIS
jgi:Tfp pilus assembly protein PilX